MKLLLSLCLVLAAQPALALSCMPYTVIHAFLEARDAAESYIVVHGDLVFDESHLPVTDWANQEASKPDNLFAARIRGMALNSAGFTVPFDETITVNVRCLGPWCGGLQSETTYLAYLQKASHGYLLETDPCGGFAFANPGAALLERVRTCFNGGPCVAPVP